jgi:hypothetical protein
VFFRDSWSRGVADTGHTHGKVQPGAMMNKEDRSERRWRAEARAAKQGLNQRGTKHRGRKLRTIVIDYERN